MTGTVPIIDSGPSDAWREDSRNSPFVVIRGEIEPGDEEAFLNLILRRHRLGVAHSAVILDSPGGDLVTAMRIGRMIRELRLSTYIGWPTADMRNSQCSSACVFIFAGGVKRSWKSGEVGLHRPRFTGSSYGALSAPHAERAYGKLEKHSRDFMRRMDIPNEIIERIFRTRSSDIDYLTNNEAFFKLRWTAPYFDELLVSRCGALSAEDKQYFALHGRYTEAARVRSVQIERCYAREAWIERMHAQIAFVRRHSAAMPPHMQTDSMDRIYGLMQDGFCPGPVHYDALQRFSKAWEKAPIERFRRGDSGAVVEMRLPPAWEALDHDRIMALVDGIHRMAGRSDGFTDPLGDAVAAVVAHLERGELDAACDAYWQMRDAFTDTFLVRDERLVSSMEPLLESEY